MILQHGSNTGDFAILTWSVSEASDSYGDVIIESNHRSCFHGDDSRDFVHRFPRDLLSSETETRKMTVVPAKYFPRNKFFKVGNRDTE